MSSRTTRTSPTNSLRRKAPFASIVRVVQTYRYDGCQHWFAEQRSPGFDETTPESARPGQ
jgi:hypothetical protein